MLKIGMIGPDFLLQRNGEIFQQLQIKQLTVKHAKQLAQIDGLLITGWHSADYRQQLQALQPDIQRRARQLSVLGIAAGAVPLGRKNFFSVIDCGISLKPSRSLTTAILEMPGFTQDRFTATFLPDVRFHHLAPNLGVLCQDQKRGPVVVRQGNYLACSYVAEFTPRPYIYHYWLEMVAALKNSREF